MSLDPEMLTLFDQQLHPCAGLKKGMGGPLLQHRAWLLGQGPCCQHPDAGWEQREKLLLHEQGWHPQCPVPGFWGPGETHQVADGRRLRPEAKPFAGEVKGQPKVGLSI